MIKLTVIWFPVWKVINVIRLEEKAANRDVVPILEVMNVIRLEEKTEATQRLVPRPETLPWSNICWKTHPNQSSIACPKLDRKLVSLAESR